MSVELILPYVVSRSTAPLTTVAATARSADSARYVSVSPSSSVKYPDTSNAESAMVVISTSGMMPTVAGDWFSGSVSPQAMRRRQRVASRFIRSFPRVWMFVRRDARRSRVWAQGVCEHQTGPPAS